MRSLKVQLKAPSEPPKHEHPGVSYLKELLNGGPMLKTNIYRQAQNDERNWSDLLEAASELNLNRYSIKGFEYWRLGEY